MREENFFEKKPGFIFVFCLIYGFHMVEEFTCGFVGWADRYFGQFDWTQNLIGNAGFFIVLALACHLYRKNPVKYLRTGMAGSMWVLANAFLHISSNLLTGEYSPGVVTATVFYLPCGVYFLVQWGRRGVLTWKNLAWSFFVGGMVFMLIPTFVRAVLLHAKIAQIFHLIP